MSFICLACLKTEPASFISLPEPMWVFDEPKVNEAIVKAHIQIDTRGRVTILEIISVSPEIIPIKPLKDAIKLARFIPLKIQNKTDKSWYAVESKVIYEFHLEW